MARSPAVPVVIAAYNGGEFLPAANESIGNATDSPISNLPNSGAGADQSVESSADPCTGRDRLPDSIRTTGCAPIACRSRQVTRWLISSASQFHSTVTCRAFLHPLARSLRCSY
jgi:hypothetical protein